MVSNNTFGVPRHVYGVNVYGASHANGKSSDRFFAAI
jgi:hypothetical protein